MRDLDNHGSSLQTVTSSPPLGPATDKFSVGYSSGFKYNVTIVVPSDEKAAMTFECDCADFARGVEVPRMLFLVDDGSGERKRICRHIVRVVLSHYTSEEILALMREQTDER